MPLSSRTPNDNVQKKRRRRSHYNFTRRTIITITILITTISHNNDNNSKIAPYCWKLYRLLTHLHKQLDNKCTWRFKNCHLRDKTSLFFFFFFQKKYFSRLTACTERRVLPVSQAAVTHSSSRDFFLHHEGRRNSCGLVSSLTFAGVILVKWVLIINPVCACSKVCSNQY